LPAAKKRLKCDAAKFAKFPYASARGKLMVIPIFFLPSRDVVMSGKRATTTASSSAKRFAAAKSSVDVRSRRSQTEIGESSVATARARRVIKAPKFFGNYSL
jgi:hypothetical protein